MQKRTFGGISYLEFEGLAGEPGLCHGVSLRCGGELDFRFGDGGGGGLSVERFSEALGLDGSRVVHAGQVHGDAVAVVGRDGDGGVVLDTDGLCSDVEGVGLLLVGADCPLVLVYDGVRRVVGVAHAGWRGTIRGIVKELVGRMVEVYGSVTSDLRAGIGPCICGRCYEVGAEVVEEVGRRLGDWEGFIRPGEGQGSGERRWWFDLVEANRRQLLEAGVLADRIELSGLCTYERGDWFPSYRRDGAEAGRWGLLAGLKRV